MEFYLNPLSHDLHIPKVHVNRYDGSDPISWDTQMAHYFSLHGINNDLIKHCFDFLYLDLERWNWYKWHKKSHRHYISWTQFIIDLYEHFDIDTHHLVHLTKLKQSVKLKATSFLFINFLFELKACHTSSSLNTLLVASKMTYKITF